MLRTGKKEPSGIQIEMNFFFFHKCWLRSFLFSVLLLEWKWNVKLKCFCLSVVLQMFSIYYSVRHSLPARSQIFSFYQFFTIKNFTSQNTKKTHDYYDFFVLFFSCFHNSIFLCCLPNCIKQLVRLATYVWNSFVFRIKILFINSFDRDIIKQQT